MKMEFRVRGCVNQMLYIEERHKENYESTNTLVVIDNQMLQFDELFGRSMTGYHHTKYLN